jgi:uncharacterized protein (DUF433 family)
LVGRTERQRGFGDFYGFVLVAQGSGELMVEHGCHTWDLAATKAIVVEAGGRFTDWDGHEDIGRPDVVASNGRLHEEALCILNAKGPRYNGGGNSSPAKGEAAMNHDEVVIQGPYGPKIKGTRVTVYDVYNYAQLGWHHTFIAGTLGLSSSQVLAVLNYIEEHEEEVRAVHQEIEERNARGNPPEVQSKLDAIHAHFKPIWEERRRKLKLEAKDEGDSGGR